MTSKLASLVALLATLGAACQRDRGSDPLIESVTPAIAAAGEATDLVVAGQALAPDGAGAGAPVGLRLRRVRGLDGAAAGDVAVEATGTAGQGAVVLHLTVDAAAAQPGIYDLEVTTADGRTTVFADALALLPAPALARPGEPMLTCVAEAAASVHLAMDELVVVAGQVPRVEYRRPPAFPGELLIPQEAQVALAACAAVPFARADLQRCGELALSYPGFLGEFSVVVSPTAPFEGRPPLVKQAVLEGSPGLAWTFFDWIWTGQGTVTVPLSGAFLALDAAPPVVRIDQAIVPAALTGCVPASTGGVQACTGISLPVSAAVGPGAHTWSMTTAAGCTTSGGFNVAPDAAISEVGPAPVCPQGRLQIAGSGFILPLARVDGVLIESGLPCYELGLPCGLVQLETVRWGPGVHELILENGGFPRQELPPVPFTLAPQTAVLGFRWPELLLAGAARPVVMQVSDVVGTITRVTLVRQSTGLTLGDLPFTWDAAAGSLTVTLPAALAPDTYYLRLSDLGPCPGEFAAVELRADPALLSVDGEDGRAFVEARPLFGAEGQGTFAPFVDGEGHPGRGVRHESAGAGAPRYYRFVAGNLFADVDWISFDHRREGVGAAVPGPDLILEGDGAWLERTLDAPPSGAWSHVQVTIEQPDGWTIHDADGSRPATLDALRRLLRASSVLWIKATWTDGASVSWLDNVSVTLHP